MKTCFELLPMADGQKSYYGKAKVIQNDNVVYLLSYNTIVCSITFNGKDPTFDGNNVTFKKHWSGYSSTTQKHINSFRTCYGLPKISKKEWLNGTTTNENNTDMTWKDSLRAMYSRRNNKY